MVYRVLKQIGDIVDVNCVVFVYAFVWIRALIHLIGGPGWLSELGSWIT